MSFEPGVDVFVATKSTEKHLINYIWSNATF